MLARDEWTHLRLWVCAGAHLDLWASSGDCIHEGIGDIAHGDDDGNGHAAFTCRTETCRNRRIRCHVDIGIGEHHHVVLGTA